MAIDPEVIPPTSHKAKEGFKRLPRWAIFSIGSLGVFFFISFLQSLLPLIGMVFLLAFIWNQANKKIS